MNKDQQLYDLIEACGFGLIEPAKRLIKEGADVNGFQHNYTPLIASICGQNPELVAWLIASGASINQEDHTALHEAFESILENLITEKLSEPDSDEMEIIALLIHAGGDIEKQNNLGASPLESLNKHAVDLESFEQMKDYFRKIVPDIDTKIKFKSK
jgi:ankyrin repeat protein